MKRDVCDKCGKEDGLSIGKFVLGKGGVRGLVRVKSDDERGWCLDCWYKLLGDLREMEELEKKKK